MRILVDNGEYGVVNRGDMAMIGVAVRRLRERWPEAEIGILTSAPRRLGLFLSDALPIVPARGGEWPSAAALAGLPRTAARWAVRGERVADRGRDLGRRARARLGRWQTGDGGTVAAGGSWPPAALWSADLVMGAGGGYLNDVDPEQTRRTLSLLSAAHRAGIPTALMGQGIGPIEEPRVVADAAEVLPRVGLIALREGRVGPGLLASLGVEEGRLAVTGDDAIELAHGLRRPGLGDHVGVNLRVVDYTGVDGVNSRWVREAVHAAAFTLRATLMPVPVSDWEGEDRRGTRAVTDGFPSVGDRLGIDASAEDAVRRVGGCRVMVTGTYHAAVFALSQGIPAVAISRSRYYDDKFLGLSEQFPGGCTVVQLDGPSAEGRLRRAVLRAWDQAPVLRRGLLDAAERQIALGRDAYGALGSLATPVVAAA